MTRTLRYLRIAFSVACGIACVLLVVLWVRSYWQQVGLGAHTNSRFIQALSRQGRLIVSVGTEPGFGAFGWGYGTNPIEHHIDNTIYGGNSFRIVTFTNANGILIPHWFALIVLSTLTALPWLSYRFSLRTLLITTTLIAVILGLIVVSF